MHVITREAIRRSGATTLADALRLAPGLQVARINASQWAVGSRGFASRLSRSLLVLIDGRSVYTPLFAGVYWEAQDVLLEDVDRIEVIRGPGGTLWGANAVNGVINIVTRGARATPGLFAQAGLGSEERGFGSLRYGGSLGSTGAFRVYGKYSDRDPSFHTDGREFDPWSLGQGGFRADWERPAGAFTLQGDAYAARIGERISVTTYTAPFLQTFERKSEVSGGNLLGRWQHPFPSGAELSLQTYYDHTTRDQPNFRESRHTFDLDAQHRMNLAARHDVLMGVGYRASRGATSGPETVAFDPATRTDHLVTGFVQDEIGLRGQELRLTVGLKVERNNYSGFELQPGLRLLWSPGRRQSVWASVSRAVRTPSRLEHDLALTAVLDPRGPVFARVLGNTGFESEKAVVYELGYRTQPVSRLALDAAAFYNRYHDLSSIEARAAFQEGSPPRTVVPFLFLNGLEGRSYGAEVTADFQAGSRCRLFGAYSYLRFELQRKPGSADMSSEAAEGNSPRHQLQLRAAFELPGRSTLDGLLRRSSELPNQRLAAYTSLDLRLAWRATDRLELAVVGQNLLDDHHAEFVPSPAARTEIERGVYFEAALRW